MHKQEPGRTDERPEREDPQGAGQGAQDLRGRLATPRSRYRKWIARLLTSHSASVGTERRLPQSARREENQGIEGFVVLAAGFELPYPKAPHQIAGHARKCRSSGPRTTAAHGRAAPRRRLAGTIPPVRFDRNWSFDHFRPLLKAGLQRCHRAAGVAGAAAVFRSVATGPYRFERIPAAFPSTASRTQPLLFWGRNAAPVPRSSSRAPLPSRPEASLGRVPFPTRYSSATIEPAARLRYRGAVATRPNSVLSMAQHCHLVLTAVNPKEALGAERRLDQFFRLEGGGAGDAERDRYYGMRFTSACGSNSG